MEIPMPRVLIADSLSPAAIDIFRQRGVDADVKTGLPKDFIDINLALSREPDQPKRYVQDRIRERSTDIRKLLEDPDTYIYVCGLKGMEAGVLEALKDVVNDGGNTWTDVHTQLKSQGRLHFETY